MKMTWLRDSNTHYNGDKKMSNKNELGMTTHILKTDSKVFQATYNGTKNFEIRMNDRDFKVGDILVLRETEFTGAEMCLNDKPLIYTGRELTKKITYILDGSDYGQSDEWVIMSVQDA
tara:strand:+ start:5563 stop:5916 length:354 start_codon:yes stop_codon:yes gene_type:complete